MLTSSLASQVDIRKVEMAVMKPWITKKVIELLGFEDDVLLEYIFSLLEDNENPVRAASTSGSAVPDPFAVVRAWEKMYSS